MAFDLSILLPRIREKIVLPVDENDCWHWTGSHDWTGYSRVWWKGRIKKAHRILYELLVEEVSFRLDLDHLCKNKGCVNPAHMEPVTRGENVRRDPPYRNKTHCAYGHPLEGDNLYVQLRKGRPQRSCKICRRSANRTHTRLQALSNKRQENA